MSLVMFMMSIQLFTKQSSKRGNYMRENREEKWYPITGYDQKCDISNFGRVRELRGSSYIDITHVQNAGKSYVYLSKDGKNMLKNIAPLQKRFIKEGE